MRRMRRIGLWFVGFILFVVLVLAGIVGLMLTQSGSHWVLNRIPGLTVQGFQGVLLGQWQAEKLHWQDVETSVELAGLNMALDAGCLLQA